MLYPFQNILDFIFPPTDHELKLRYVTPERFITWYRPNSREGIIYLSVYQLPEVQAAIAACKFEHSYKAAKLLAALLKTHLETLPPKNTLLIPIPLSPKRKRERLFNQVERVLQNINQLPYFTKLNKDILIRLHNTKPQTSLTRKERLKNVQNAFAVREKSMFNLENIERIIICDDVLTTGATLLSAKTELMKHVPKNIEVLCVAWAH